MSAIIIGAVAATGLKVLYLVHIKPEQARGGLFSSKVMDARFAAARSRGCRKPPALRLQDARPTARGRDRAKQPKRER